MDDLLTEFLTETTESLDQLDLDLVKLERDPNDPGLISNIFRLVHTIKGTCGFLGLPRLESVAHAGENILGKFRDREIEVTPEGVTLILNALDRIKEIIRVLERTEAEPDGDDKQLINDLNQYAESNGANFGSASAPTAAVAENTEIAASEEAETGGVASAPEPDEFGFVPVPASETGKTISDSTPPKSAGPETGSSGGEGNSAPGSKSKAAADGGDKGGGDSGSSIANQSIRVNVELLENLMTTVSELVLTRNQLLQMVRGQEDSEFTTPLQRLSHITTELQENVMRTRMQPIGNAWAKLPRIVRDLSRDLGKKIELKMIGADTELDRQVLELIRDPLTHMVRNSADHGLEIPEVRRERGKNETGTVTLNAYHEGGHIIIEIGDDGAGIDVEKVKAKILEKGLASETELATMPDDQVLHYIFDAGFSTAQKVTAVSGRGVGMDVVRTNIERIGGSVDLTSKAGFGSLFTIKIPLTLAIVSALIVQAGGERFCMPQISVLELVRASKTSEHRIETIKDTPVLRLRDRLLPLISLSHVLDLTEETAFDVNNEAFIIVVQVGAQQFGVIVERVFDTEEIVVKPVAPILRDIQLFSGNTILGDGSVVMILDPNGMSSLMANRGPSDVATSAEAAITRASDRDLTSILIFRAGGNNAPMGIPLGLVSRLEEIDLAEVEYSGETPVIQYRGELMRLASVDGAINFGETGKLPVLVFSEGTRKMGLVVDEILDILEEELKIEVESRQPGLLGSAILDGAATEMIDAGYYVALVEPDWYTNVDHRDEKLRVLVVDDSSFFRNMLEPILETEGYQVVAVDSAEAALELRERGELFDLIVSDVEMIGMSGLDFVATCRADPRWKDTPVVALSSRTSSEDLDRGREAGFDDYVAKFDRTAFLSSLQHVTGAMGEAA